MLTSMTGFAHASVALPMGRVSLDLKSVNRRHLQIDIFLPSLLNPLYASFHQNLTQAFERGHITLTLTLESTLFQPKSEALDTIQQTAKALSQALDLPEAVCLTSAMQALPSEAWLTPAPIDLSSALPLLRKGLDQLIEEVQQMRQAEGEAIAKDFYHRLTPLTAAIESIQERIPHRLNEVRHRFTHLCEEWKLDQDERILKEIALVTDRLDITEEITRLHHHLESFKRKLEEQTPVGGKVLEFLLQELVREINTLGAKGHDIEIADQVISFKGELERIREQLQNIE